MAAGKPFAATLKRNAEYTWVELGAGFGFKPGWLNRVGGMASLPRHGAVLVITHPGGGRSFNYRDRWIGADLLFTGKGQVGHQRLSAENRLVADNSREILAFEHVAPAILRYLGVATCVDVRPGTDIDRKGAHRRVYRFRLRFGNASARAARRPRTASTAPKRPPAGKARRPRPFDPNRAPASYRTHAPPQETQAEKLARQEKATRAHQALLVGLYRYLVSRQWRDIEDIHVAVDMWARPRGRSPYLIFEAKTLTQATETKQTRAALGQLLEYRHYYRDPKDQLCVLCSQPISDERVKFLRAVGVDVAWLDSGALETSGTPASTLLRQLL